MKLVHTKRGRLLILGCLLSIIMAGLSVAAFLNRTERWIPRWSSRVLTEIVSDEGHSYLAQPHIAELSWPDRPSPVKILEDGRPLPVPLQASTNEVRQIGLGRYTLIYEDIYFSSSDNSDARSNGRVYTVVYPFKLANRQADAIYVTTLAFSSLTLLLMILSRRLIIEWLTATWIWGLIARVISDRAGDVDRLLSFVGSYYIRCSLLTGSIFIMVFLFSFGGPDWETLTTKHYWQAEQWFYGGYASQFEETRHGYRTIMRESLVNYYNLFPFSERVGPNEALYRVDGWPSTERLSVPFLAYMLIGVTGGRVGIWQIFILLNIAIWLSAIFLMHRLVRTAFDDRGASFVAALLVLFYPAFTINFHGLKIAYLNTLFLLVGIYAFEKSIRAMRPGMQFLYLVALFFPGLFTPAGWLFLFLYIVVRYFGESDPERWQRSLLLLLTLIAAQLILKYLRVIYHLPQAEKQMNFSYAATFHDTVSWLQLWIAGKDISQVKFLNYPGYTLFTAYLPLITRSFFAGHWLLLLLAIGGWVIEQRSRIYLAAFVILFFAAHGGYMITGWNFHYGYLSAPAAMMLIFPASYFLSWLFVRERRRMRILAIALLIMTISGFLDHKRHADLYYGGYDLYHSRIYLHYGASHEIIKY